MATENPESSVIRPAAAGTRETADYQSSFNKNKLSSLKSMFESKPSEKFTPKAFNIKDDLPGNLANGNKEISASRAALDKFEAENVPVERNPETVVSVAGEREVADYQPSISIRNARSLFEKQKPAEYVPKNKFASDKTIKLSNPSHITSRREKSFVREEVKATPKVTTAEEPKKVSEEQAKILTEIIEQQQVDEPPKIEPEPKAEAEAEAEVEEESAPTPAPSEPEPAAAVVEEVVVPEVQVEQPQIEVDEGLESQPEEEEGEPAVTPTIEASMEEEKTRSPTPVIHEEVEIIEEPQMTASELPSPFPESSREEASTPVQIVEEETNKILVVEDEQVQVQVQMVEEQKPEVQQVQEDKAESEVEIPVIVNDQQIETEPEAESLAPTAVETPRMSATESLRYEEQELIASEVVTEVNEVEVPESVDYAEDATSYDVDEILENGERSVREEESEAETIEGTEDNCDNVALAASTIRMDQIEAQETPEERITLEAIENARLEINDDQASLACQEAPLASSTNLSVCEMTERLSPECKIISPSEGDSVVDPTQELLFSGASSPSKTLIPENSQESFDL